MVLRAAAAFAAEWEVNQSKYETPSHPKEFIENRAEGIFLASFVDSFLVYVSDLLTLIFAKYPKSIPDRQVSAKSLWESESLEDLRWDVIEATVSELSYKSFDALDKFVQSQLGFQISTSKLNALRLKYIFEMRNSIVHSRGYFSSRSDRKLGASGRLMDTKAVKFGIEKPISYLISTADNLDERAAKKFKLEFVGADEHYQSLNQSKAKIDGLVAKGKRNWS
jgi:hypothetical protein